MQENIVLEKARKLGLNKDLPSLAAELGAEDIEDLNNILDEMLSNGSEKVEQEGLAENENPNNETINQETEKREKFGEREYKNALDKDGVYDKNHYKNKQKELDENVRKAKEEKNNKFKSNEKNNAERTNIRKNKFDKAKDNANYLKANIESKKNKYNKFKANWYNTFHPLQSLKNRTKKAAKDAIKDFFKTIGKAILNFIKRHPYVLVIAFVVIIVILLIMLIIFFLSELISSDADSKALYGYDYVENSSGCNQITVTGEYAGVYNLEDYIAGVVQSEVGGFVGGTRNEAAKAGAVAARSYLLTHLNEDCSIENSTRFQTYKSPSEGAIAVAQATKGLVLTDSSGNIKSTQYDAFCTDIPQTDENYYIICQKEQKIPRSWVDAQSGIAESWKNGTKHQAHGNGMSQWGAAYLAEEKGYDFKKILEFYYSDMDMKSIYKSFGSGNYPINPDDELYQNLAFLKDKSLSEFLISKGTSIESYNEKLKNEIEKAGVGTREGVVTAALYLIGSLAEMDYKLTYQWGGKYYAFGASSNWGSVTDSDWNCNNYASTFGQSKKSTCTTNYKWKSFDCSGFVNWTLINGMQNGEIPTQYTDTTNGTTLKADSAVCEPGGTLVSEGHIVLVVGIDNDNKRYIVAESTGSRISEGTGGVKLSYYAFNKKGYVCKNLNNIYGD